MPSDPTDPPDPIEWLSPFAAVRVAGVPARTLRNMALKGAIDVLRLPNAMPRYNRAQLERLAATRTYRAAAPAAPAAAVAAAP
jgi:hypothetical protein